MVRSKAWRLLGKKPSHREALKFCEGDLGTSWMRLVVELLMPHWGAQAGAHLGLPLGRGLQSREF